MGVRTWNKDRAAQRINAKIDALPLKDIEIKDYVRDTDLSNLSSTVAYRVDGVHLCRHPQSQGHASSYGC
jgi:hypothetical protein